MAIATAISAVVAVVAASGAVAGATGAVAMSTVAMYALTAVAVGSALKVTGDIVKSKELSMAGGALALAGSLVGIGDAFGAFNGFSGAEAGFAGDPGSAMGQEAIVSAGQDAGVPLTTASTSPAVGSTPAQLAAANVAATPAAVPVSDGGSGLIAQSGNWGPPVGAEQIAAANASLNPPVAPVAPVAPGVPTVTPPAAPPDPNSFMKAMAMMTGAQAVSGLAGGYFAGVSAEEQLEFQKLMNQQKYAQAQEVLERGRYAPKVAFKGAPSGGVPTATPGMIGAA